MRNNLNAIVDGDDEWDVIASYVLILKYFTNTIISINANNKVQHPFIGCALSSSLSLSNAWANNIFLSSSSIVPYSLIFLSVLYSLLLI